LLEAPAAGAGAKVLGAPYDEYATSGLGMLTLCQRSDYIQNMTASPAETQTPATRANCALNAGCRGC